MQLRESPGTVPKRKQVRHLKELVLFYSLVLGEDQKISQLRDENRKNVTTQFGLVFPNFKLSHFRQHFTKFASDHSIALQPVSGLS